jgi:pimeloyl-ACP methyl ester carboxylesterase
MDWHGEAHAEFLYNLFSTHGGAYGVGSFDIRSVLGSVTCPTLVLYPDRSFLFDVGQALALYKGLPHGELAVLPHCGHNTYEQRPEDYVRIVTEFHERHHH